MGDLGNSSVLEEPDLSVLFILRRRGSEIVILTNPLSPSSFSKDSALCPFWSTDEHVSVHFGVDCSVVEFVLLFVHSCGLAHAA